MGNGADDLQSLNSGLQVDDLQNGTLMICESKVLNRVDSLWFYDDTVTKSLPSLFEQLALVLIMNYVLVYIFKLLRLPEISAQILVGVLMGPSKILGDHVTRFFQHLFPLHEISTTETIANLGLVYFMFIVGLETDMRPIKCAGKKAIALAAAGFAAGATAGYGLYFLYVSDMGNRPMPPKSGSISNPERALFWAVALSGTQFPDLAKILTSQKLINTDYGQLSLIIALINDFFSWIFVVAALAAVQENQSKVVLTSIGFTIVCFFVIRPMFSWLYAHTTDYHSEMEQALVTMCLFGAVFFGFCTDLLGAHSITGGYLFGISFPRGLIKDKLIERVDAFVSTFLMPFFFVLVGLRFNFGSIFHEVYWTTVAAVLLLSFLTKFLVTFCVSLICNMQPKEGLSLGLLMNTKGILTLIALSSAVDIQVLQHRTFSAMILACWIMTLPTGLVLHFTKIYTRNSQRYRLKNIENSNPQNPLRVMATVFVKRDANKLVDLIDASNVTRQVPTIVFAAHLTEISKRPNTMLITENSNKIKNYYNVDPFLDNLKEVDNNDVLSSFSNLRNEAIMVERQTIMSSYSSIHEDISYLAEEKHVKIILVNFHKRARRELHAATAAAIDDPDNDETKGFLKNMLRNPPCSVGIFIDRELGKYRKRRNQLRRAAVFFFGGPDDREALAYAKRLITNPNVQLTVIRFVHEDSTVDFDHAANSKAMAVYGGNEEGSGKRARFMSTTERMIDDDIMRQFRFHCTENRHVDFHETTVTDVEQVLELIKKMEEGAYDLYIVGRNGRGSSLLSVLAEIMETPELGPLGDTLAASTYVADTSILILQQHVARKESPEDDDDFAIAFEADGPAEVGERFGRKVYTVPHRTTSHLEPFSRY